MNFYLDFLKTFYSKIFVVGLNDAFVFNEIHFKEKNNKKNIVKLNLGKPLFMMTYQPFVT